MSDVLDNYITYMEQLDRDLLNVRVTPLRLSTSPPS
jgi:hypothetical protein